jgi:hypothetical protein
MYKNFNLTDEERKQIMEMHQTHGYKKPLIEEEEEEEEEEEDNEMKIGSLAFLQTKKFSIDVSTGEYDSSTFTLTQDYDSNIVDIEVDMNMSDIYSDEQLIEFVKQKAEEGYFRGVPHLVSFDIEKGDVFDFT